MHIFAAFVAVHIAFVIAILCVAWTPFAALICARIAQRRGLNVKRPAVHGAIYSALLFLPWRHLTRQMRGEPINRGNIANQSRQHQGRLHLCVSACGASVGVPSLRCIRGANPTLGVFFS